MIIAFIYINFDGTSKNAKKCQKELGTFLSSKRCHEVSKNATFAFFGTKNAKLATMLTVLKKSNRLKFKFKLFKKRWDVR